MTIKRYGFGRECVGNIGSPAITEQADGPYVRYEDFQRMEAAYKEHNEMLVLRTKKVECAQPANGEDIDPFERFKSPLTPYGLLVRALRIVAGTTLMEMAKFYGIGPARLSSLEFGRRPLTRVDIEQAVEFFESRGVSVSASLLEKSATPQGGQT